MAYEKINYALTDGVARIAMNDPAARNAASPEMAAELLDALGRAEGEARAVMLTGEGSAFCAGANLSNAEGTLSDPMRDVGDLLVRYFNPIILQMKQMEQPIVTAVRGPAAGVGASVAMAGDIIVCGEGGFFLQAFRHIGLSPDGGSSWLLTRAVGRVRAMELMLLGDRIFGAQALEWGLVNRVVPDDDVEATAMALATSLAAGPRSLAYIKQVAWAAADENLEKVLQNERFAQRESCRSEDFVEGVTAFLGKRAARFAGR